MVPTIQRFSLPPGFLVVEKEQEHHFHDHHGIDRNVPVASVAFGDLIADKAQIEHLLELPQNVFLRDSPGQVYRLHPQFDLILMNAHHARSLVYESTESTILQTEKRPWFAV